MAFVGGAALVAVSGTGGVITELELLGAELVVASGAFTGAFSGGGGVEGGVATGGGTGIAGLPGRAGVAPAFGLGRYPMVWRTEAAPPMAPARRIPWLPMPETE